MTRMMFPRVLFEPPTAFSAGPPDAIEVGSVVTNVEQRVYVIRIAEGFRALSAVCTHLGCITRFQPDRNIIACPCHGSQFTLAGDDSLVKRLGEFHVALFVGLFFSKRLPEHHPN